MKAQPAIALSPRNDLALKHDGFKPLRRPEGTEAEIQECLLKLKDLVPTVPHNKKISKTQLLQHVIDYILDLELTLEFHPAVVAPPAQLFVAHLAASAASSERRPLGENTQANTLPERQINLSKMDVDGCLPSSC